MNFWNVLLWMGAIYLGFNFLVFLIKMMIYRWYLADKSMDDDEDDQIGGKR